jgi:FKBP-type peptidyl-prolyl cis-trans isomerase SlyD
MAIGTNKVVTLNFTLKDEEGNVIESTENAEPFQFISGNNQILPKLEEEVDRMLIGTKKKININPADAYGEYNQQAVQKIDKKEFPENMKLEEGMRFVANSPEGKEMPFIINSIDENEITVDFNHPLAGKNLNFNVELLDVRDATPEELSHGHVHGSGGHHH